LHRDRDAAAGSDPRDRTTRRALGRRRRPGADFLADGDAERRPPRRRRRRRRAVPRDVQAGDGGSGTAPPRPEGGDVVSATEADERIGWLAKMLEIRLFEEKVQELFMQGEIQGTTHLCQGQEAVSVGAVGALEERDYLTITYRGHGHALAHGM